MRSVYIKRHDIAEILLKLVLSANQSLKTVKSAKRTY